MAPSSHPAPPSRSPGPRLPLPGVIWSTAHGAVLVLARPLSLCLGLLIGLCGIVLSAVCVSMYCCTSDDSWPWPAMLCRKSPGSRVGSLCGETRPSDSSPAAGVALHARSGARRKAWILRTTLLHPLRRSFGLPSTLGRGCIPKPDGRQAGSEALGRYRLLWMGSRAQICERRQGGVVGDPLGRRRRGG